jgi:hypothetical protein
MLEVIPRDIIPAGLGGTNPLDTFGKGGKLVRGEHLDLRSVEAREQSMQGTSSREFGKYLT